MNDDNWLGLLEKAIQVEIHNFNKKRGRRKELSTVIVLPMPRPYKNYGLKWQIDTKAINDDPFYIPDMIRKLADGLVRTLLKRSPRPYMMAIDILRQPHFGESSNQYFLNLKLPVLKRNKNSKVGRHEELYGVDLFIDDSYMARVRGLNIYIHPQYELSTKSVLSEMSKDWSSLVPGAKRLGDLSPAYKSRRIKKQLKLIILSLITK